jgi:ferrochelatase
MVQAIATRALTAFAYQSKSPSPIPVARDRRSPEVLQTLKGTVSVAPIGFVSDHVEILYDLDILHRGQATALGLTWDRLPMPNDDPLLIEALASAARKVL